MRKKCYYCKHWEQSAEQHHAFSVLFGTCYCPVPWWVFPKSCSVSPSSAENCDMYTELKHKKSLELNQKRNDSKSNSQKNDGSETC